MNGTRVVVVVILAFALLVVLSSALFTVAETEQVVITQFGKLVGRPINKPGLHVKVPFVQTVHAFEKRFLEWDGEPNQIPTEDKRFIWVDSYARWRITDPLLFFQRLTSAERSRGSTTSWMGSRGTRSPSINSSIWCA